MTLDARSPAPVALPAGGSLVLRNARLPGSDDLVDVRIDDGAVTHLGYIDPAASAGRSGAAVEVVDLGERWLIPGLWDNHVHFTQWAQTARRLDVSGAASAAHAAAFVAARIAARATFTPSGDTLIGFGFRDAMWADAPSRAVLDAASASALGPIPVALVSGDLHSCWLNSAALARYGLPDHATGLLREADAFRVAQMLDTVSDGVVDGWVDDAARAAAARGVVGVVDMEMTWNLDAWQRRIAAGTTALRVEFGVYSQHLQHAADLGLRGGALIDGTEGLLSVGPFKVITDGSLNTRTAYCVDAYPGLTGPDAHGLLNVTPDELLPLLRQSAGLGLRAAVHAIGDQANRLALDALEQLAAEAPTPHFSGLGHSIEHAQLLSDDDVQRFARLGIVASVQPEHALDDREVADRFWAGRTQRAFPLASLLAAGVELAFGSDAPVAPLDPWVAIAAAVGRGRDGDDPWHPEQSVSRQDALAASARGRHRVSVGDVADLAVCEIDPLVASVADLRRMPVAATLLAGRFTHRTL
ncbi:amidohydrolase [Cryobacterium melibiosiphilum]|uniref:Amidohydrolase n=1 Tax=Cryobacterium melibiosiphilum TaxID=995039 RepID=A0A3A5MGE7_9MICO|nr:amidohydrolase family protein [Cryobacterium melibiosiphilum]RJT84606.1 amidohydrolase [Cryobacterium melibiosiphilum]